MRHERGVSGWFDMTVSMYVLVETVSTYSNFIPDFMARKLDQNNKEAAPSYFSGTGLKPSLLHFLNILERSYSALCLFPFHLLCYIAFRVIGLQSEKVHPIGSYHLPQKTMLLNCRNSLTVVQLLLL